MKRIYYFVILIFMQIISTNLQLIHSKVDHDELKCLVCKSLMEEIDVEISKLDPKAKIDIGSYTLDVKGDLHKKQKPQILSEMHLSEVLENICKKMEDYVRGKHKTSGKLTLFKIVVDGVMNPKMSEVDLIQDDDLNKSVEYNCEVVMEEQEDSIIKAIIEKLDNIDIRICSLKGKYCSDTLPEEDYQREEL